MQSSDAGAEAAGEARVVYSQPSSDDASVTHVASSEEDDSFASTEDRAAAGTMSHYSVSYTTSSRSVAGAGSH